EHDADPRPKDLFAGDGHRVLHVREYRGLHEVAAGQPARATDAAGDERRALVDALLDQALDLLELHLAHHGAEQVPVLERIAHLHAFGRGLRDRDRLRLAAPTHAHA